MPLPGSVKTVPVHVRVVSQDGAIGVGKVRLEGPVALKDATSKTVVGAPRYSGTLDTNGEITFPSVIANDTSNVSPSGWSYTLVVETDIWRDRIQIQVPSATVGTLEIAQTAVSNPGVASVTYVLATAVGAPSGVASLDSTGKIPSAQIPATGSTPDATTTAKGVIQLAGDLAGTATAPTVTGLAGKATDTAVVHLAGAETITGVKTFSVAPVVPAAAFPETAVVNLTADLAAKATMPIVRSAYITTGVVTLAANAAWTPLAGFELALPAVVGDYVELAVSALFQLPGGDFLDLVVLVGSAPVTIARRSSSGTSAATVANEGEVGLYPNASGNSFRPAAGPFAFTVAPGDLDAGNVRFALVARGAGGGKVFASTSYPFHWRAINYKTVG